MSTPRIAIRNWGSFQHYKERTPPWIKMHRSLLNNKEWHALSGDACKLLAECWLLASEYDEGVIPMGTADLAWRLRRSDIQQVARLLQELATQRFVELLEHDASTLLADCTHTARPETEAEREPEAEVPSFHDGQKPKVETSGETVGEFRAAVYPAIRKYAWLGSEVPPNVKHSHPSWTIERDHSICANVAKKLGVGSKEIVGILSVLRDVYPDVFRPDMGASLHFLQSDGRLDRANACLAEWRKREQIANHKPANEYAIPRLQVAS